jgi:hypothetical protein
MRGIGIHRTESRRTFDDPPVFLELRDDGGVEVAVSALDVFEKDPPGLDLLEELPRPRPEVPRVLFVELLARGAVRLTRDARHHKIHEATEFLAREGEEIVPDRRRIQSLLLHPVHEDRDGVGVPFTVGHSTGSCSEVSQGGLDSEVEPSDACAEGKR